MDAKPPAILVLGGAFCPVHLGHVAAMTAAKEHVESRFGVEVVAGYLACAKARYCTQKYKGKAIPELARLEMCNLMAREPGTFLRETPQAFGCARACAQAMVSANHASGTRIFVVQGADKARKQAKRDHVYISRTAVRPSSSGVELVPAPAATLAVSATLVREELCRQSLPAALRHVVAQGMISRAVADYIAANTKAFMAMLQDSTTLLVGEPLPCGADGEAQEGAAMAEGSLPALETGHQHGAAEASTPGAEDGASVS